MRITDEERRELLADARRMVKETNFCADMCLRIASDAERDAIEKERQRIRAMAAKFSAIRGRKPAVVTHSAQIIPFPIHRRLS